MKGSLNLLKHGRFLAVSNRFWRFSTNFSVEIARCLGNPFQKNNPVFLVGCGRSGTNMLSRGLGKSYKVKLYNEDNPAAFEKWRIKSLEIVEQLTASGYAQIKLYKPILDTHMAAIYLSEFPNAKVIFIFRHYSDVINSSIRYFGVDDWPSRVFYWIKEDFAEFSSAPPPDKTKKIIQSMWNNKLSAESSIALYWLFYNRLYFDLGLNQNSNVALINYENVVTQPDVEFHNLCKFLNINYSSKMVEGIFSSSINQIASPKVERKIQVECDELWDYLCGRVN